MREELRAYFERELTYLRQLGGEFAGKYPKIASRLALDADGSQDPHVERLIESVAFLTARLRHKLDDDLPEISDTLLGILYPHYLAPIPSMTVVQFHVDPTQAQLGSGYDIPRHTVITTRPVRGVRCRFRTAYPVRLWPLEVADATLESPITLKPLGPARDFRARSSVRLRLRTLGGVSLAELRPPVLRIFLHGEGALAAGLYEMLCGGPCQVEVHPTQRTDRPPLILAPDAIRPVGFDAEEALVPCPPQSFRGFGLLEEYFAFPEKFLFFDLAGVGRAPEVGADGEVEVRIFSARTPRFDQPVQASAFRLGCAPLVNIFSRPAEPIWMDHTKDEYLVVPDVHAPWGHEVFSVDSVMSAGREPGETREFQAFYALRHGTAPDAPDAFWLATRRENPADGATDVYLSTVDANLRPTSPPAEALSVTVTCTNRDLPAQIPFSGTVNGDLDSEHLAPFVRLQCLAKPTPPRRRDPGRGAHWRLVSHLALNHLSIVEHGRTALQGILELYDVADSPVTRRQIAGIRAVSTRRVVRKVGGAFCRGLRVTVDFDREHFAGTNPYLLAAVLERFLALYVSINSFSQLVARMPPDEELLSQWPPRAGDQILL
jgi:type VI secretion system protein ImpG